MSSKKKQLLVVKSLRDVSPKRGIYISRKAERLDGENYENSQIGNASPTKPEKRNGVVISRSVLGDVSTFEELDKRGRRISTPVKAGAKRRPKAVVVKADETEDKEVEEDMLPAHIRILKDPAMYVAAIQTQLKKATDVRTEQDKKLDTLVTMLPINERFNMNKEGEVLARWQERQRDWSAIQNSISKLVKAPLKHSLMMSKTGDHRIKQEEYDLVQAAIPAEVKYESSIWERSLRGGATRSVSVGHVFSGLACEVEKKAIVPAQIRKPRTLSNAGMVKTKAFDVTKSLTQIKKKYHDSLAELRGHSVDEDLVDSLIVRPRCLFQWAMDSATAYMGKRRSSVGSLCESSLLSNKSGLVGGVEVDGQHPVIDLVCSSEVVFEAKTNASASNVVVVQNTGNLTVAYDWRPNLACDSLERAQSEGRQFGSEVAQNIRQHTDLPRASELSKNKLNCFFCPKSKGVIMPGQTVVIPFEFNPRGVHGLVSQTWTMHTHPRARFTRREAGSGSGSGKDTMRSVPVNAMEVQLQGVLHSMEADESIAKRQEIQTFVTQRSLQCAAEDEVYTCLRRVRSPVRIRDVQERLIGAFKRINQVLLSSLTSRFGSDLPVYVTTDRLQSLASLSQQVAAANISVLQTAQRLRLKKMSLEPFTAGSSSASAAAHPSSARSRSRIALEDAAVLKAGKRHAEPAVLKQLKDEIFPEKTIEIFDEIEMADIEPSWDLDVANLLASLQESLQITYEVRDLEGDIAKLEKFVEKQKLKEARRLARLAAADGDDDDEDEEEEEEEEEEDVVVFKHQLTRMIELLLGQCNGSLVAMVSTETLREVVYSAARASLSETLGDLGDWVGSAKVAVGLDANAVIPTPFQSPFTSAAGAASWKNALAPVQEVVTGKGGKAKPAAAKKAKDKSGALSPEQIDEYYAKVHEEVRNGLLNAADAMFASVDVALHNEEQRLGNSNESPDLFSVAAVRPSDLAGASIVFLSFNGLPFVPGPVTSAYDTELRARKVAVAPILLASQSQASAIVLLYESLPGCYYDSYGFETASTLANMLQDAEQRLQDEDEQKSRRRSYDSSLAHIPVDFNVIHCANMAQLTHQLQVLSSPRGSGRNNNNNSKKFPVLILEDLNNPSVVPPCPPLPPLLEEDDDAPIAVGGDDYEVYRAQRWLEQPHRVPVCVMEGVQSVRGISQKTVVSCLTDVRRAIDELLGKFVSSIWVDSSSESLFLPTTSTISRSLINETVSKRVVDMEIKHNLLWSNVVKQFPGVLEHVRRVVDHTAGHSASEPPSELSRFLASMFPRSCSGSSQSIKPPALSVFIGGELTADKLRVMDSLLDSVPTIIISGEVAIPFLALSGRVVFRKYEAKCDEYRAVCANIVMKARMKGVRLELPVDVVTSEEPISSELKRKCFDKFDSDSRDEGVDFDAEAKQITVGYPAESPADTEYTLLGPLFETTSPRPPTVVVEGFVYDIGEASRVQLKASLSSVDMLVVWGTAGVCEVSGFQMGHRTLVQASVLQAWPDDAVQAPHHSTITDRPLHTWVIGDAAGEWFTRFADPDGEFDGDLVESGKLSFMSRQSRLAIGVLGGFPSMQLTGVSSRPNETFECRINSKREIVVEEEEDEEEDD